MFVIWKALKTIYFSAFVCLNLCVFDNTQTSSAARSGITYNPDSVTNNLNNSYDSLDLV